MNVRLLTTLPEFEKCLELQRDAFGAQDVDLMPKRFMVVLNHIGGAVFGAYEGDQLVAFLSTIPGIREGRPYWHSQQLAVSRAYWNAGVGAQLKLAQRDEALRRGIHLIEWTFDPLESKNAYLNIEKLGAIVRRYYVHHYGEISSSIFQGLESDRVVAEWRLDKPRPVVTGETRRVAIPADLQSLKKQDLEAARALQRRVRDEFLKHTADDFFVVALERKGDVSEYLFIRGASGVDSGN
jgi:predicted GNAT superfamily acetyltransferase